MDTSALHILLIEDDPGDAVLVERMLLHCKQKFTIEHRESLESALQAFSDHAFDVALMDLSLTDSLGLDGLNRIHDRSPELPIVVLTGLSDDATALQALEQGAQDYVVKGNATSELLDRTLRYAVQRQQIQTENRRLLKRMEELAQQDPLTGVLNRHSFAEALEREWQRAIRHEHPLSCVVLDIDFFKRINDTFGHAAGDRALKLLAQTLFQSSRASDYVGRLGGEEFCVLLAETTEEAALHWAERLRRDVASLAVPADPEELRMTASLGVASFRGPESQPQSLVDQADEAMFVAKQLGRDQVVSYGRLRELQPTQQAISWKELNLEQLMRPLSTSLHATQSLVDAVEMMEAHQTDSLPVVGEEDALVGVVGYQDLMAAGLNGSTLKGCVKDVMQRQPVVFPRRTPPREVCEFLCRAAVRQVFVTDQSALLGVVERGDFVRWFYSRTLEESSPEAPAKKSTLSKSVLAEAKVTCLQETLAASY